MSEWRQMKFHGANEMACRAPQQCLTSCTPALAGMRHAGKAHKDEPRVEKPFRNAPRAGPTSHHASRRLCMSQRARKGACHQGVL